MVIIAGLMAWQRADVPYLLVIIWALVGGIACGLFFGEYCAWLEIVGDGFVDLLQMTVLPYVMVFAVVWIVMLLAWMAIGVPLGPAGPLWYEVV